MYGVDAPITQEFSSRGTQVTCKPCHSAGAMTLAVSYNVK